ncbi:four-carbon acid sugar kinase family protein, partial [Mesorhizobium sp. GbtcB19]|uniref:four-carbon acid sugar kinase family protein n=1 Tax=Mesorhizobium sp. GbtcB19 TaxID=2824764 RepID=UPI001C30686F
PTRRRPPPWMDTHLEVAFNSLYTPARDPFHYKVCSTFDSSPTNGSIGRAIEVGRAVLGPACVPLVAGAPQPQRYTPLGH